MRRTISAALLLVGLPLAAHVQEPPATQSGMASGQMINVTGTVEKIDKERREITVRTPSREQVVFEASDQVRNFDKIKIGDRVSVTYSESLAISLHKSGEPSIGPQTTREVEHAPPGGAPAGRMMQTTKMTATVVSVNAAGHKVVLRGPNGNTREFDVQDPALQLRLSQLKPGDQIDVNYTEAMAASVQPAP